MQETLTEKNQVQRAPAHKVLLVLLPYWSPLIPPLGISCLKSHLQVEGYQVATCDANVDDTFRKLYYNYFEVLKAVIPGDKQGNLYNIGNDVLQDHMLAYFSHTDEAALQELISSILYQTFFCRIDAAEREKLNGIVGEIFQGLEAYMLGLIEKEQPTVLGLSVFSGSLPASLFAARLVKEKYPHITIIMGGGVFSNQLDSRSPNFENFLENAPYVDKIIIGEGEILLLKWLRQELDPDQRVYSLKDVEFAAFNLQAAPLPDFSDFELEAYSYIASYSSRSCPFQCSFCSETLYWGDYRKKDPGQIVKECLRLYSQHSKQLFLLGDSLLNPVISKLAEEMIQCNKIFYWDGYLRADKPVCNRENTLLWRRGGFYRARLGIESGSQHVLDLMNKKITPAQIKAAVASLAAAGIKTTTYWVIGHPGETEGDFQETLDLIREMKDDIYEADCNPFNFYLTGQVDTDKWIANNECMPLLPERGDSMLNIKTWILNTEPTREVIFNRLNRFVDACRKMNVPNPYSIYEIYQADMRWKKLHKNAVPSITSFSPKKYISECKSIK